MEKEILKKAADGTFTIHITLIDFQAIGRVVKDFIQTGKAIWSFSFNLFSLMKDDVTGVVNAIQDVMKFLFESSENKTLH